MTANELRRLALPDESSTDALATRLAPALHEGGVIHLCGDLGVGKTTFARALLRALGVRERIKSPTYSLIESYALAAGTAHHLDLYRIADPGELEWLGIGDLDAEAGRLLLIEWPERGADFVPAADLVIRLAHAEPGRRVEFDPKTALGKRLVAPLDLDRLPTT